MKEKRIVMLFVVLLLSIMVVAKVQIKFSFWGSQAEIDKVKLLKETFEVQNPDIEIMLEHIPGNEYEQKLMIETVAGNAPDVQTIREVSFMYLTMSNYYLPLDSLIKKFNLNLEDFYPNLLEMYKYNGKIYALPREFTPVVTYYNKAMFDEAGLEYPSGDWTWDDFLKACKALTKDSDGDGEIDQYGVFMVPWDALYLPLLFTNDANILTEDGRKSRLLDPNIIEAFQFAYDLIHKYKVAPPLDEANTYGWINGFAQKKFAMIFQGRWATPIYLQIEDFEWDVAPVPYNKKRVTVMYSSSFGISTQSKHPEEAFRWIAFLVSEEGQKIWGGPDALVVPANRKVAESDNFITPDVLPKNDQLFLDEAKNYGQVPPRTPSFAMMYQIVDRYLNEIFIGLRTVEDGLKAADKELQKMLDRSWKRLGF